MDTPRRAAGTHGAHLDRSPLRRRGWLVYLAGGAVATIAYPLVATPSSKGPVFNLIGASAVVAILAGVRLHRPARPLPWVLFAAGLLSFVIGDVFYYTAPLFRHGAAHGVAPNFPSVGDGFYLAVYPLLVSGLAIMIRRRNPGRDRASVVDALIVTTGLAMLSWVFLIEPYARQNLPILTKVFSLAYPSMDVLMLGVAVRLAMDRGTRRPAIYLMGASTVCTLVTDTIYGLISLHGTYHPGGLLDVGWIAFYVLWGAAALHPSMNAVVEAVPQTEPRLTPGRLALLLMATLLAPAVQLFHPGSYGEVVVIGGSALLFLLVVARMAGLIRRDEASLARETALRQAGAALVAAGSAEAIADAARQALQGLVGRSAQVGLLMADDTVEGVTRDLLVTQPGTEGPAADALADRLGLSGDVASAWPIRRRGTLWAVAVVRSRAPLAPTPAAGVQTLVSQVVLAVERDALAEEIHRQRSERRFASLVQHSTDVVTVIDLDTTIRYQSPAIERLLGYGPEGLVGTLWSDLMHPADRARVLGALGSDLVPGQLVEYRLRHADGSWRHIETLASDLLGDPEVRGIVLNSRDVSERRRTETELAAARDQAVEASRLKSDFLANMSHEIRTPMHGIIGLTQVLAGSQLDPRQRGAVEAVRASGQALLGIVNEILDFSSIEAGRVRIDVADVDIRSLVDDVVGLLAQEARRKVLAISGVVGDDVPRTMTGDAGRLRQVLVNLAGNAIKFTDFGKVTIRATLRPGRDRPLLAFEVSDTGIGIRPEERRLLFDPFSQVDSSSTRRFGGTGLGLAISKRLVTAMGGDIGVDSEPGRGSTFWFTVPQNGAAASAPDPGADHTSAPSGDPERDGASAARILVVDDNRVNQMVAVLMLEHLGYLVDTVGDGREAIRAVAAVPYDAVLMDCQMPGLDGYQATAEIRVLEGDRRHTPIIAMTASAMQQDRDRCLAAGMDDYLAKPVGPDGLRAALARWVLEAAA